MKKGSQSDEQDKVLKFAAETPHPCNGDPTQGVWKILIADDDEEVHVITKFVLEGCQFRNRSFQLLDSYNYQQTIDIVEQNPDLALIFLDVVMDTDDSGIRVAQYIREKLNNHTIRIILRTGQPGYAPEEKVILQYDINDYKLKTELSAQKLKTSVITSIRNYTDIDTIMKNNSELLYLNNLKNTFISRFSKELKPTLDDLSSQLGQLENTLGADHEHVKQIMKQFKKLENIIHQELSVISLENEVKTLFVDKVDILQLLEAILARHQQELQEKKLDVTLDIPQAFREYHGNNHLFELLLDELLCNALYYNRPQGRINIRGYKEGAYLVLSISDTGVGIPEDEMKNIFDAFYRGRYSEQLYKNGAGLGLFMVKRIVTNYNGFIRVESNEQGSNFDISFLQN